MNLAMHGSNNEHCIILFTHNLMNLNRFNSLSLLEKADELTRRGLFLQKKDEPSSYRQLYQLDNFFVVTNINPNNYELLEVTAYQDIPEFW